MATYAGEDKRLKYLFENGGGGGSGGAYYHADWIADGSSAEDTQLTDIVNIYNAGKYLAVITMPAISSGSDTFHVKLSGFSDITPKVFTGLGSTAFIFELTSNDVPKSISVQSFLSTSVTWTNKYKGGLDIFCLSTASGSGDVTTLAGLQDVNLSNLQDGQTLIYDETNLEWVNVTEWTEIFSSSVSYTSGGVAPSFAGRLSSDINYKTGYAFKVTSDKSGFSVRAIDVFDPLTPPYTGCFISIDFNNFTPDATVNYKIYAKPITSETKKYDTAVVKLPTNSGGGTTVIANPSGAATGGDLIKLQVGDVIYSIPSGGGGGNVLGIMNPVATETTNNSLEYEATV